MAIKQIEFYPPEGCSQQRLTRELSQSLSLRRERAWTEHQSYFDTFDWRLFNQSLVLKEAMGEFRLLRSGTLDPIQKAVLRTAPSFIEEIPDGPFKRSLQPVIEMRRLFKLLSVDVRYQSWRVLNRDEKTVCRVIYGDTCLHESGPWKAIEPRIRLQPIRGYEDDLGGITEALIEGGFRPAKDDSFLATLNAIGTQPRRYAARPKLKLNPNLPSEEAVKHILLSFLRIIRRSEEGIRQDLDTEFLHEYRVALRRTRSILGQMKKALPPTIHAEFRGKLAGLARTTNQLREFDVLLLKETHYHELLPKQMRIDIAPFFKLIRAQRRQELARVVNSIDSEETRNMLKEWYTYLKSDTSSSRGGADSSIPITDYAANRIRRVYRRIVRVSRNMKGEAEDAAIHSLRIEGKKLRYLLESFSGLFPKRKVTALIKGLKQLQDHLGNYCDLCVDLQSLPRIARGLELSEVENRRTAMAIGHLLNTLETTRITELREIPSVMRKFTSRRNRIRFKALFAARE